KATTLAGSAQKVSEPALPPTPPPPPVKDGYRRDYSLPKPGNSQARTSLTAGTGDVPEAEVASKSSATPTSSRIPWQTPHTPSEDSQDRGNQMKAFRPNAPFKDTPLPDLPTSGAISGPSTRGTVREIAERLESRSGRASAAAAASGNALVGAFTSARGSGTKNEDISNSYEVSEDESTAANSGAREVVSTRDLGNATSNDQADAQVLGREGKPTATSPLA